MTHKEAIADNIKAYRKIFNLTQDKLAEYLDVKREMISYYENASRNIPAVKLIKLSDLFGIELSDLIEENCEYHNTNLAFAFRTDDFFPEDLEVIAGFRKVVKNYIKLKKICGNYDC